MDALTSKTMTRFISCGSSNSWYSSLSVDRNFSFSFSVSPRSTSRLNRIIRICFLFSMEISSLKIYSIDLYRPGLVIASLVACLLVEF